VIPDKMGQVGQERSVDAFEGKECGLKRMNEVRCSQPSEW